MKEELDRCRELLGVAPGASAKELKEAYRDLAKVWHPDRFSHDPRLQRKAQEKLKEINEAYDLLTSGRAARPTRPAPAPEKPHAPAAARGSRGRPPLVLLTLLIFGAVFFAAFTTFVPRDAPAAPGQKPPAGATEAAASDKGRPRESGARNDAGQPARVKEREGRQAAAETAPAGGAGAGPGAPTLRPMPTVTVRIDTLTGLLATRDCPNVAAMTYPAGDEPRRYCTSHRKTGVPPEPEPPGGSRLKSIGKGVAKPFKWLAGDGTKDAKDR